MSIAHRASVRLSLLLLLVPSVARAEPDFDPLDETGWPIGVSLEQIRDLPECGPDGLPHTPGAPITCRPPMSWQAPQWSMGVDWTSGAVFGNVPLEGAAHALGAEAHFAILRQVELGARYEMMGIATPDADGSHLSNQFLGQLRLRAFHDELTRNAWTFTLGAGYALRDDALGGSALLVRAALGRESSLFVGHDGAMRLTGELAYEQSLGDAHVSAVLASLRLGFELGVRPPENLGERAPIGWRHTTSLDVLFGPWLGFGMTVGLRAGPHWSLETSAGYLFDYTSDQRIHGYDGAAWSLVTGPRLQLGLGDDAAGYLQAQGGEAWVARATGGELRPIATGEVGLRAFVGCGGGLDVGFWLRSDLDAGELTAGGFVLRMVMGSGHATAGGLLLEGEGACAHRQVALALPPPVVAPTPPPPPTYEVHVPEVPVPDAHVGARVDVALQPPQPIVIEVDLGARIGPLSVGIDPRLIPLNRLRGAGWLEVELSGPADGIASFRGQLSAQLSRNGIRVDTWATGASNATLVHAKFTVWPPGTRPR